MSGIQVERPALDIENTSHTAAMEMLAKKLGVEQIKPWQLSTSNPDVGPLFAGSIARFHAVCYDTESNPKRRRGELYLKTDALILQDR